MVWSCGMWVGSHSLGAQGTFHCPGPSLRMSLVSGSGPPCAQNNTQQVGCRLMSWMGWLGGNFWENQPWRGVGCRVVESLEWARASQPSSSMWSFQWCLRNTRSGRDSHQYRSLQPACIHPHPHPHPWPRHSWWQPHPSAHCSRCSVPSGAGYNGQRLPWLGNGGAEAPALSSPGKRQLRIKNVGKTMQTP